MLLAFSIRRSEVTDHLTRGTGAATSVESMIQKHVLKVKVTMLMFVLGCRCSKLVNFAALMTMQAAQPRSICKGIAWLDLILIFLRAVCQALVHKSVFNEFCSIFEAGSVQTDVLDSSMVPCKIISFARRWLKTWGQGRLYRVARSFLQLVGCQCSEE